MIRSHIESVNGTPYISVNGKAEYPLAYTTYFEECQEWKDIKYQLLRAYQK